MQYGTRLEDHKCAACYQPLTIPVQYQNDEYYHSACWENAVAALLNAERIARMGEHLFETGLLPELKRRPEK